MFSRDDVYAILAIAALLWVVGFGKKDNLDVQSKPAPVDSVMLIKFNGRHREPAKVQWLHGKPYCSPYKDNSGMGLLLPKGLVDGVGNSHGWEPLTPNMDKYYSLPEPAGEQ